MAMAMKRKKAKSTRKARSDRCGPLREQIQRVDKEIDEIRNDLSDSDIPKDTAKKLRALLRQLEQLRARLMRELDKCEALPDSPLRK